MQLLHICNLYTINAKMKNNIIQPKRIANPKLATTPMASVILQPVNRQISIIKIKSSIIVTVPHYDIAIGLGRTQHPRVQQVRSVNPLYYLHHQVDWFVHNYFSCSYVTLYAYDLPSHSSWP